MAATAIAPYQTATGIRPYFPELDGVRAIAAVMVMIFHFAQIFCWRLPFAFGQSGVDLFFVLSGFLITTILLQARPQDWHEIRNFYMRRTLRIFPLYYAYLLVASIVSTIDIAYWFYLENYPIAANWAAVHGPLHFWSLAVEEQFYVVWPFLVLFWPRRWLAHAMWSAIALSIVARMLLVHTSIDVFYLTITRLDGLAAGSLLALACRRRRIASRTLLSLGAALCFAVLLLGAKLSTGHGVLWVQVIKYTAAAGLYTGLLGLLLSTSNTVLHRALRSRPMRAVGRVSYGLYVFHPAVLAVIEAHPSGLSLPVKIALFFAVSYLLALASFYGFERRFTRLKQRLAPEKSFAAPAAALPAEHAVV